MTRLSLPEKILAVDRALEPIPTPSGVPSPSPITPNPGPPLTSTSTSSCLQTGPPKYSNPSTGSVPKQVALPKLPPLTAKSASPGDGTPIDLFFSYDPFHTAAHRAAITVPFGDRNIRVLSATHLTVCKAVFDRPKDWIDIEAMLGLGAHIDAAEALRWVSRITGDDDPRYNRLATLLTTQP